MSMVKIIVNEGTNLELRSFEFGIPLCHALFNGVHEIFELVRFNLFGANEKLVSAKIPLQNGALLTIKNLQC